MKIVRILQREGMKMFNFTQVDKITFTEWSTTHFVTPNFNGGAAVLIVFLIITAISSIATATMYRWNNRKHRRKNTNTEASRLPSITFGFLLGASLLVGYGSFNSNMEQQAKTATQNNILSTLSHNYGLTVKNAEQNFIDDGSDFTAIKDGVSYTCQIQYQNNDGNIKNNVLTFRPECSTTGKV